MILPPHVDEATMLSAFEQFKGVVGDKWVFTDEEDLDLYRDSYSPSWDEEGELRSGGAVAPASVEEVQAIVRIANELKVPLFPISTGMNLGYGGSAPNLRGTVILDLKRMNKIIEVNDERNFAIVEPGVSYMDLYRYIEERGLDVMIDVPDTGWGSVLGNAMDHGAGFTKGVYKDHWGSHSGLEVVLADGTVLRTGMGAVENSETFAEYPYGFGPTVDGLFGQGNAGIVTKMGMRLQPKPKAVLLGKVSFKRRSDIITLLKVRNRIEDSGLGAFGRVFPPAFMNPDPNLGALVNHPDGWENKIPEIEQWLADNNMPFWDYDITLHGPHKTNEGTWEYIQELVAAEVPDAVFSVTAQYDFPLTPEKLAQTKYPTEVGVPNLDIFFLAARSPVNPTPPDGHIWFSPVIPSSGESLMKGQEVFAKELRDAGLPPLYGPFSFPLHVRDGMILLTGLPVFKNNPEMAAVSRQMFAFLVQVALKHGWAEYRTHPAYQDLVMSTYNFNDGALLKFHNAIKDAVDPNGILAPGRSGIWPKHLREM